LADKAEASRFTELRGFLDAELHKLSLRDEAAQAQLLNRIEHLERELRTALKQSERTLTGQIAQQGQSAQPGQSAPHSAPATQLTQRAR
jgi:hypothetical protein